MSPENRNQNIDDTRKSHKKKNFNMVYFHCRGRWNEKGRSSKSCASHVLSRKMFII